jgi:hypothetical protein
MNARFHSVAAVARVFLWKLLAVPFAGQSADRLTAKNVKIAQTMFKGRSAIQTTTQRSMHSVPRRWRVRSGCWMEQKSRSTVATWWQPDPMKRRTLIASVL